MIVPLIPHDEAERLGALRASGQLDTPPEERFDRLTRLAQRLFKVPIALVSLIDENRQWFKSCIGLDVLETSRDISFCGHAILGSGAMVVEDARLDPRFSDNPLVTGPPFIRFYAGHPISTPSGLALGTLCLISPEPRSLSFAERSELALLAGIAAEEMAAIQIEFVDPETGLPTRKGFDRLAVSAIALAKEQGQEVYLGRLLGRPAPDSLPLFAADFQIAFARYGLLGRTEPDCFEMLAIGIDQAALSELLSAFCVAHGGLMLRWELKPA